jgi:hypothetical protein
MQLFNFSYKFIVTVILFFSISPLFQKLIFLIESNVASTIYMTPELTCIDHVVQTNLVYDKYRIDCIFNVEVNGR